MASRDQRRRQLARQKFERQQQRRAERRARVRRRNAVIAAVVAVAVAGGGAAWASMALTGDDKGSPGANGAPSDSATPSASPTSKAPDPCDEPAKGSPAKKTWKKEPALTVDKQAKYTMALETTCGKVTLSLDAAKAPRTVNSFAFLAQHKFFDHTKCHRLVTGSIHVLQCGDPTGTGSGGPGYTIPDENLSDPLVKDKVYPAGTVAMANQYDAQKNTGRNTGGSQFFLVFKDSPLPPDYTPFGRITGGMDVLEKVAGAGTATGTPDGPPNATVVIDRATVVKG
ncbi:peptidylprolyl isomerase [Wenjunlia tyrosinilytica]|uniref:peptidylprolyl isomerase n=1 Tax=Wenjunlia tyrosinilytica TaxID=1544741 RepID=UPI00166A64D1|nr:peptidylprolyl isomerase [Wenjunlia tyrosinilytica]